MSEEEFRKLVERHAEVISQLQECAHALHAQVGQTYGNQLPYGYHLDRVADGVRRYGHAVCGSEEDIVPLFFGAYFHDSIEDARLTYNDVMKLAKRWMDNQQALAATEMVYALTNEKGRTRAERANEKYYQGIRKTPFAPFLKLADRLANITYSCSGSDGNGSRMKQVYRAELPHFLAAIRSEDTCVCKALPPAMVSEVERLLLEDGHGE